MTTAIGNIGSAQGAQTTPVSVAPALSAAAASSFASASSNANAAAALQNPRVVLDPSAGFITQYLSANGSQVISQTPSAITVAYLRLGLTADGLSKQNAQPDHSTTA